MLPLPGLSQLINSPRAPWESSAHWPEDASVFTGALARLDEFSKPCEYSSFESFFKFLKLDDNRDLEIMMLRQTPDGHRPAGIQVSATEAERIFNEASAAIFVRNIHLRSEAAYRLLYGIESQLGIVARSHFANVYIAPKGQGTGLHSDEQDNFALQLLGRKQWRYAKNESVRYQRGFVVAGQAYGDAQRIGRDYPDRLDSTALESVLEPGDVFFSPRGLWHETFALENSMSLTFVIGSPTWMDLTGGVIRDWMLRRAGWREPVFGLQHDLGDEKFELRIEELREEFSQAIQSKAFTQACKRVVARKARFFWKNHNCVIELRRAANDQTLALVVKNQATGKKTEPINIDSALADSLVWIRDMDSYFTVEDFRKSFPDFTDEQVELFIRGAAEMGLILERYQRPFHIIRAKLDLELSKLK